MAENPIEISDASINDGSYDNEKGEEMSLERKDSLKQKTLKKHGHLKVKEDGQVTYKRTSSSAIMAATQLGIGYSVGRLTAKQERDILMQDFSYVEKVWFPGAGSRETPSHRFVDFKFKSYAPSAFRYFRDLFGMQPSDFLMALSNEELREMSNPGASGSLFFLSADDNFIIKTVQHKEATFLQQLLPGYYMNLHQNPRTLLPKFFGLYCYQSQNVNIRLVVMNNILPTTFKCQQIYDLKGSTFKRKASKSELAKKTPTKKDLDFRTDYPEGITLDPETYDAVVKTLKRDCRVLESFKIMDYSLLLGIHKVDQAHRENNVSTGNDIQEENPERVARRAEFGAALEAIQIDKVEGRPLGGIPAKSPKGDQLILFLGVIDILQSYRIAKKLEHGWKSLIHDGDSVSVHNPSFYAQRFISFMADFVLRRGPSVGRGSAKRRSVTRQAPNSGSFLGSSKNKANETFSEKATAEASTPRTKETKPKAVSVTFSVPTVIAEPDDQMIPPPYEEPEHINEADIAGATEATAKSVVHASEAAGSGSPVESASLEKSHNEVEQPVAVTEEIKTPPNNPSTTTETSENEQRKIETILISQASKPNEHTETEIKKLDVSEIHKEAAVSSSNEVTTSNVVSTSHHAEGKVNEYEAIQSNEEIHTTIVTKTSTTTYKTVVTQETDEQGNVVITTDEEEVVKDGFKGIVEALDMNHVDGATRDMKGINNGKMASLAKGEFNEGISRSDDSENGSALVKADNVTIERNTQDNTESPDILQVTNIDTVLSNDLPNVEMEGTTENELSGSVGHNDVMVTIL